MARTASTKTAYEMISQQIRAKEALIERTQDEIHALKAGREMITKQIEASQVQIPGTERKVK